MELVYIEEIRLPVVLWQFLAAVGNVGDARDDNTEKFLNRNARPQFLVKLERLTSVGSINRWLAFVRPPMRLRSVSVASAPMRRPD
jgi:hypothetical protein